ncbi:MAG: glycosyltransferase [Myxococcales bacterium]|nr:glycosyltransferase [Myxococcota bacterium]MDW8283858.1 glycosyltransferase [Myxococcales bacterium]
MSTWAILALQVACGTAAGLTLVTLLSLALLRRQPPPVPERWPSLLLVRPCEGADDGLLTENILSSATATYPGPRRVRVLVPSEDDPAWVASLKAADEAARLPAAPSIEVVCTRIPAGGNRKVAQLLCGTAGATEEIIVNADSDVRLEGDDLMRLVAALLADPTSGAAFAPPQEVQPMTIWDRASAALVGGSQQSFLALYAVSRALGGVPSLAGALYAYRREAMERAGGLEDLRHVLGEDHELARRLARAGHGIALSAGPARCMDAGRSAREVIERAGRWLMVVRAQRPWLLLGYPLLLAATPLHLALAALVHNPLHAAMAVGLWGLRAVLAAWLARLLERPPPRGPLWAALEVLRAELLLWAALVRSLWSRHICWRGHRYRVGPGGYLIPQGVYGAPPQARQL